MSWSASKICADKNNLEREIADAKIVSPTVTNPEMEEALHAAKSAAIKLFEHLSAIGDYPKYGVTLTGHANVDHKETPGWAHDGISISIYGLSERDIKYWEQ